MSSSSTMVKKRKPKSSEVIGGVIGSLVIFAIAVALFSSDHQVFGCVGALVGLVVLINAFGSRETISCPACNHLFSNVSMHDTWLLCPSCGRYLERKEVVAGSPIQWNIVEDDHICEDLNFQVKVPTGNYFPNWPPGCCVCGKRVYSTGVSESTVTRNGSATTSLMKFAVSGIPYCEQHYKEYSQDDARGVGLFERSSESKKLKDPGTGGYHVLGFRSYKYFREFRALNRWQ